MWPAGGEGQDRIGWWRERRGDGEMRKRMLTMSYMKDTYVQGTESKNRIWT